MGPGDQACTVGRTTISPTSTPSGRSMAYPMADATADGTISARTIDNDVRGVI